jgi:hypothetical protein
MFRRVHTTPGRQVRSDGHRVCRLREPFARLSFGGITQRIDRSSARSTAADFLADIKITVRTGVRKRCVVWPVTTARNSHNSGTRCPEQATWAAPPEQRLDRQLILSEGEDEGIRDALLTRLGCFYSSITHPVSS